MGNSDFCSICKKHVTHDTMDWLLWENEGIIRHTYCFKAQSEVVVKPKGVKAYKHKHIPSGLMDKILRDNTIGEL